MKVNNWIVYREIAGEYLLMDLRPKTRKYIKYSGVIAEVLTVSLESESLDEVVQKLHIKYAESSRSSIEKDVKLIHKKFVSDGVFAS